MSNIEIRAVDQAWRTSLPQDAALATQAYLERLSPDTVARANAYFEGGYWLLLWNVLLALAIAWVLLEGRRSARFRDWSLRVGKRPFIADAIFGGGYWLAVWLLTLPLATYQSFIREHQYGMANQGFGAWLGDQVVEMGVTLVVAVIAVPILLRLIRHFGARWWIAATVFAVAFQGVMVLIAPVWIDPLFNTYKPVTDQVVKQQVLAMAHANGVPVDNVYEVDASRQTTRVSANVSGIFGTAQVRLNDNLLRRTSLPEIRAVMGHELGHYVLNHIHKLIAFMAILLFAGFAFVAWVIAWALRRWGARWQVQGVGDSACLPLLVAALTLFLFLATPALNTLVRVQEIEADQFGLNLAREPHGFAEVILKLTEYRKPDPGALEEFVFFDHPSTRYRVHEAMQWREAMTRAAPTK